MIGIHSTQMTRFKPSRSGGFSLVELMIGSAIGLTLLAGMATLFVNNSRAQSEIEKANRQIENGRYGIALLSTDLTNAGFYGEFDPTLLANPAILPQICTLDLDQLRAGLVLPVQGLDRPAASALPCLPDRKSGTDVLVVRRAQTCVAGEGNCAPTADGGVFIQASLCHNSGELGSTDLENHYDFDTRPANLTRHKHNCTDVPGSGTLASIRRYLVNIYYVANNSEAGDGVPTLKRAELGGTSLAFTSIPLVEGIDNFQVEFGQGGGVFSAEPASVADWRSVVTVKLHLLSRNLHKSVGHLDTKSYHLGSNPDGSDHIVSAPGDQYKRHVFQSQVVLRNPAGRKM